MNSAEIKTALKVKWRCPSNIAIVKYWGKKDRQIPCNSSLSMTLANAYTEVVVELCQRTGDNPVELDYYFEGELNEAFGKRVAKFIETEAGNFSFATTHKIVIHSKNSFPHSAGIASSASAFGAISLALLDLEYSLKQKEKDQNFYRTASNLARLGSGSASRSLYPSYALWGNCDALEGSSVEYAVPVKEIHPTFKNMKDAILIVEDEPKKVSSSVGHGLMVNHPYASQRFLQANERTKELVSILAKGDMDAFIQMSESEALTLHAMMMTSEDYYMLMKPGTIEAIEAIMQYRAEKNVPVCFTLDAGPNVHVLYSEEHSKTVEDFLIKDIKHTYKKIIFDKIGEGPVKMDV